MRAQLDVGHLINEARAFSLQQSAMAQPSLYGVTDGKAVGTYLEHSFQDHLAQHYDYTKGNSASGIDFPDLRVDIKVTSIRQPQSSCPYKSARQKIYGPGYSLLVFVYEKADDHKAKTGTLSIRHTIFVEAEKTADYQTTTGLRRILDNGSATDPRQQRQYRRYPRLLRGTPSPCRRFGSPSASRGGQSHPS
jgi:hypothetical protein